MSEAVDEKAPQTVETIPEETLKESTETVEDVEQSVAKEEQETSSGDKKALEIVEESKVPPATTDSKSDPAYAEHVSYQQDGSAIYTDPKTNYKYKWNEQANNWLPCNSNTNTSGDDASASNPYENEHYKWCSATQKWLPKVQSTIDSSGGGGSSTETEHYKWDAEKNEWVAKTTTSADVTYGIDEQGQRIYTDHEGAVYFWDADKNAWFPKIDDDFMARYQMNYGFIDHDSANAKEQFQKEIAQAKQQEEQLKRMTAEAQAAAEAAATNTGKRKANVEPPKWFDMDPEHNTKVYVSNLPLDITIDEFAEVMGKCGMIMRDPQTQKYKLKLYTETDGQIKGDGLCDYIKVESVGLALKILDEYDLRGHKIRVQPAKFQMRGEYNPALKPKRKKKDKEKLLKIKEKLFDWRPEKMRGERTKNEKTVIIKNLFEPDIFEKEVQLILDYQNDLREECSKCGTVRKVVIYDRHAEGVAQINMSTPEEADLVIQMMHGRFFGKRQLSAEHWDGKTKYKIAESETEVQKRLSNWDKFLETDEEKSNSTAQTTTSTPEEPQSDEKGKSDS